MHSYHLTPLTRVWAIGQRADLCQACSQLYSQGPWQCLGHERYSSKVFIQHFIALREMCECALYAPCSIIIYFKSYLGYPLSWKHDNHSFQTIAAAKSLQSCPTLCDPIDSSPPGSPIPGILQARTLEWIWMNVGVWSISEPSEGSNIASMAMTISLCLAQCLAYTQWEKEEEVQGWMEFLSGPYSISPEWNFRGRNKGIMYTNKWEQTRTVSPFSLTCCDGVLAKW